MLIDVPSQGAEKRIVDDLFVERGILPAAALTRIRDGALALNAGLVLLRDGQGLLASRLGSGYARSLPLETRLARTSRRVGLTHDQLVSRSGPFKQLQTLDRLESRSPGFFRSGYVTVAALEGAHPDQRRASLFLLDSTHGGQVGRVQLLPDEGRAWR